MLHQTLLVQLNHLCITWMPVIHKRLSLLMSKITFELDDVLVPSHLCHTHHFKWFNRQVVDTSIRNGEKGHNLNNFGKGPFDDVIY